MLSAQLQALNRSATRPSMLEAYFGANESNLIGIGDVPARDIAYESFPAYFTWSAATGTWTPRQRRDHRSIGRVRWIHPRAGEEFYLRRLLLSRRGQTSFEHARTVDGRVHETFKAACVALGVLAALLDSRRLALMFAVRI